MKASFASLVYKHEQSEEDSSKENDVSEVCGKAAVDWHWQPKQHLHGNSARRDFQEYQGIIAAAETQKEIEEAIGESTLYEHKNYADSTELVRYRAMLVSMKKQRVTYIAEVAKDVEAVFGKSGREKAQAMLEWIGISIEATPPPSPAAPRPVQTPPVAAHMQRRWYEIVEEEQEGKAGSSWEPAPPQLSPAEVSAGIGAIKTAISHKQSEKSKWSKSRRRRERRKELLKSSPWQQQA